MARVLPASAGGNERPNYTSGYTTGYSDDVEAGSFVDYWRLLSRRKLTLLAISMGCALAGLLFAPFQSPVYQARASIEIEDVNREFLNMKQMSPVDDPSTTNDAGFLHLFQHRLINRLSVSRRKPAFSSRIEQ